MFALHNALIVTTKIVEPYKKRIFHVTKESAILPMLYIVTCLDTSTWNRKINNCHI